MMNNGMTMIIGFCSGCLFTVFLLFILYYLFFKENKNVKKLVDEINTINKNKDKQLNDLSLTIKNLHLTQEKAKKSPEEITYMEK